MPVPLALQLLDRAAFFPSSTLPQFWVGPRFSFEPAAYADVFPNPPAIPHRDAFASPSFLSRLSTRSQSLRLQASATESGANSAPFFQFLRHGLIHGPRASECQSVTPRSYMARAQGVSATPNLFSYYSSVHALLGNFSSNVFRSSACSSSTLRMSAINFLVVESSSPSHRTISE